MLARLDLVRHGEVHNPDGIVYADLPGYGLSAVGRNQARKAGSHLGPGSIDILVASPLQRATETAGIIAGFTGVPMTTDDRLTEWGLGTRWAGVVWDELPTRFPGELEAYLSVPTSLDFAPESIEQVADRMARVVADLGDSHPGLRAGLVSHQDPLQALRLRLTGRPLSRLQTDKPGHACVITLTPNGDVWDEIESWCPEQAAVPFPPVGQPGRT